MAGFTKLFSSILTSTVWQEDDPTRLLWITMLAAADARGIVEASIPGLAALARIRLPECETSLNKLSQPDPYSRTQEHEGRRIDKVTGGWKILNYAYYRNLGRSQDRNEYFKEWRTKRNQPRAGATANNPQQPIAEEEAEEETTKDNSVASLVIAYWNTKPQLPKVIRVTTQRRKKIKARMSEALFAKQWQKIIDTVADSPFCCGENDRGWKTTLDWIAKNDENYVKVLEGKYKTSGDAEKPKRGHGSIYDEPLEPPEEADDA